MGASLLPGGANPFSVCVLQTLDEMAKGCQFLTLPTASGQSGCLHKGSGLLEPELEKPCQSWVTVTHRAKDIRVYLFLWFGCFFSQLTFIVCFLYPWCYSGTFIPTQNSFSHRESAVLWKTAMPNIINYRYKFVAGIGAWKHVWCWRWQNQILHLFGKTFS